MIHHEVSKKYLTLPITRTMQLNRKRDNREEENIFSFFCFQR